MRPYPSDVSLHDSNLQINCAVIIITEENMRASSVGPRAKKWQRFSGCLF
jgi:hypothetical protein